MKNLFSGVLFLVCCSSVALAGVSEWEAAATSGGAGFIMTGVTEPLETDIGSYDLGTGGGVSYEFIYNADVGGASSAFMGSLSAPAGDSAGIKLDQWPNSGTFGATAFGVADYTGTTPYILNEDTHVVFVADGADTTLYVNGAESEVLSGASFALSGLTGIGHAFNHGNDGSVDALNGTIIGTAVYDSALDSAAVQSNFNAFAVPEPNAILLIGIACLGLATRRR